MIVTAEEVGRSLRGTVALLNRQVDGLRAFDMSERGFWGSFGAILLTLPAFVVWLALERARTGHLGDGTPLIDLSWSTFVVLLGHVATFAALPLAMIVVARRLGLGCRYVPFVIVTNWILVLKAAVLSVPWMLLLLGWATPDLATFFAIAFAIIILRVHWFATKLTLGVPGGLAAAVVGLGILLNLLISVVVKALVT